ncbi:uncharacterized protein VTP21DRAFT_7347 [Calcarisporiella thermophila]|uniref:uncharacterized protein n=1 Tax=Calcarisporiella thermophila TaxID=911321 RepID=UPI0037428303
MKIDSIKAVSSQTCSPILFSLSMTKLVSLKFEVFGRVQGVFFRKYAVGKARGYKLVGWVRNTSRDTVEGVAQGEHKKIQEYKHWLRYEGSPKSEVTDAKFEEKEIEELEYEDFEVRH